MTEIEISAKKLCEKFIRKVELGWARSQTTLAECKALLEMINEKEGSNPVYCGKNLYPILDDVYDIGSNVDGKQWRNLYLDGRIMSTDTAQKYMEALKLKAKEDGSL